MTKAVEKFVFPLTGRLRVWTDRRPGLRRVRTGAGFGYRTPDGKPVKDAATLARIRALAIPPAWENVSICPDADGHLQATGTDARGRKQYRYHPAFRAKQEGGKFARLLAFGRALSGIRERVEADLAGPGLPKEKVLAAVVALLDRTHIRVGNAEYAKRNKSYGLSTLLDRHATFSGAKLKLTFVGKSGVKHTRTVTDARLARIVRKCRDLPGQDLFQYEGADGLPHPIGSTEVNAYIREAAGAEFTAKDFRTWAGTVRAAAELAALPTPETKTASNKAVVGVIRTVAEQLGNTAAVCRKSYVHPGVIEAFVAGAFPAARKSGRLSADEARVLGLLKSAVRTKSG